MSVSAVFKELVAQENKKLPSASLGWETASIAGLVGTLVYIGGGRSDKA